MSAQNGAPYTTDALRPQCWRAENPDTWPTPWRWPAQQRTCANYGHPTESGLTRPRRAGR